MSSSDVEQLGVNVIRGLVMDAPQRVQSGHTGTAMALAPLAHVLWSRVMRYDPSDPRWPDRDRFILSAGHASILLYSMLYLTGYGLELDDLKTFRQWGSRTPGHPEAGHTPGVEVTTGALGQGFANGVGMGIAERWLRNRFGAQTTDHHIFVICSDGDLMEGISHEAASLAGNLGLGRLVYVYDDNHITIDGPTEITFTDDTAGRFNSYGWHVEVLGEVANDTEALEAALRRGMAEEDRPSLLVLRSHIAWPAPHATDTSEAHGSLLGEEEIRATKEILGLPPDETFWVPEEVLDFYRRCIPRGQALRQAWESRQDPGRDDADLLQAAMANRALTGWEVKLPTFQAGSAIDTRRAINTCINATADMIPGLMSGSADVGDTGGKLQGEDFNSRKAPGARQIAFGVRELGMGGTMNGMALHGGVIPVGGTYLVFSDYARSAVRLAALSGAKVIWFFSHDSIGLGEDGPTHQPVEQLAAMRAMPHLSVIRPADGNEVVEAWRVAVDSDGPTLLILSRQNLPVLEGTAERAAGLARGAYVLSDPVGPPDIVLVGTGSEVQLCVAAAATLGGQGVTARVVSLPSWDLARQQDQGYLRSVFPPGVPRFGVEAAASQGWCEWEDAGLHLDRFGASAPGETLMANFGFTSEGVVRGATKLLQRLGRRETLG
jgi:transketolase